MKRFLFFLGCLLTSLPLFAQTDSTYIKRVEELYGIYTEWESATYGQIPNAEGVIMRDSLAAEALLARIRRDFDSQKTKDQEKMTDVILSDLVTSFDKKANVDFLSDAERALVILPEKEPACFDILGMMADIYIGHDQKEALGEILDRMREHPSSRTAENQSILAEYEAKFESMLPFEESLAGYWISNTWSTDRMSKYRPWLIVSITPDGSNGLTAKLLEDSVVSTRAMNRADKSFRVSGEFQSDPQRGTFLFNFFTNKYRQGNTVMAHSLVDSAADTRAHFHAMAKDDRLTFGESLQTDLAGEVFASIFEAIAHELSVSKIKEDYFYLTGGKESGDVLTALFFYQKQVIRSDTMYPTKQTIFNSNVKFWRWNYEDNIVFGKPDCSPISPYVKALTTDMELFQIQWDTRLLQKKYTAPAAVTFAGAALWYLIGKAADNKLLKNVGRLQMVMSVVVPVTLHLSERQHKVEEYNKRQYDRLYELYSPNNDE